MGVPQPPGKGMHIAELPGRRLTGVPPLPDRRSALPPSTEGTRDRGCWLPLQSAASPFGPRSVPGSSWLPHRLKPNKDRGGPVAKDPASGSTVITRVPARGKANPKMLLSLPQAIHLLPTSLPLELLAAARRGLHAPTVPTLDCHMWMSLISDSVVPLSSACSSGRQFPEVHGPCNVMPWERPTRHVHVQASARPPNTRLHPARCFRSTAFTHNAGAVWWAQALPWLPCSTPSCMRYW